ncbi:MAG: outer membrane protein assembly factor BamE [Gammaproteobacteria bacterium]|nr:outer membrane protein assembly factor BamE [Gammaproteobacteria bacterium]
MDHDHFTRSRTSRFARKASALVLAGAAGLNAGCEMPALPEFPGLPELPALPDLPGIPGVYRIDIQQGNIVDREMLDQLEIGMEPRKVRFILGTPLLVDPFNQNRWDYFYTLRHGSGEEVGQRVSVYFVDDRLARIEDHLDPEAVPELAAERAQTRVKVPKRPPPKGLLDRLVPDFLTSDDDSAGDTEAE